MTGIDDDIAIARAAYVRQGSPYKTPEECAVLRLADEVERLRARVGGECIGCRYDDGPDEYCPQHGRTLTGWIEQVEMARAAANELRTEREAISRDFDSAHAAFQDMRTRKVYAETEWRKAQVRVDKALAEAAGLRELNATLAGEAGRAEAELAAARAEQEEWCSGCREPNESLRAALAAQEPALAALAEILETYWVQGHPGRACLRTEWIAVETVEGWRDALAAYRVLQVQGEPETAAVCSECQGTGAVFIGHGTCRRCCDLPGWDHEPACGWEPCRHGCPIPGQADSVPTETPEPAKFDVWILDGAGYTPIREPWSDAPRRVWSGLVAAELATVIRTCDEHSWPYRVVAPGEAPVVGEETP